MGKHSSQRVPAALPDVSAVTPAPRPSPPSSSDYWGFVPPGGEVPLPPPPEPKRRQLRLRGVAGGVRTILGIAITTTLVCGAFGMGPAVNLRQRVMTVVEDVSDAARHSDEPSQPEDVLAELVATTVVVPADLGPGLRVAPSDDGESVKGTTSLDNCGYRFTTERHRVARRAVTIVASSSAGTAGQHEVVAYDSARQAAKALEQWRASLGKCQTGRWYKAQDGPRVQAASIRHEGSRRLPIPDNDVSRVTMFVEGHGGRVHVIALFQRHDQVLSMLFLASARELTAADEAAALRIAGSTGRRLLAASKQSTPAG